MRRGPHTPGQIAIEPVHENEPHRADLAADVMQKTPALHGRHRDMSLRCSLLDRDELWRGYRPRLAGAEPRFDLGELGGELIQAGQDCAVTVGKCAVAALFFPLPLSPGTGNAFAAAIARWDHFASLVET